MITIKINSQKLDTAERKAKAFQIEREMNIILNSDLFKQKIMRLPYALGELSTWRLSSNQAILDHITKSDIEIDVDDYYSIKKVIGFTYPNVSTIFTNTKYFDQKDLSPENHNRKKSGSNFLHELGHKLGFSHDFRVTDRRRLSLCYLLNNVYEECWDALIAPKLERVEISYSYRKWFKSYVAVKTELRGIV